MAGYDEVLAEFAVDLGEVVRQDSLMKQIDLEPRDYRAEPLKGEPILGPNWLPIALQFGAMFLTMAIVRYFVL